MSDQLTDRLGDIRRNPPSWLFPAAVTLVAAAAAWPAIAEPGLLNTRGGGDSPFLLQRLHQLVAALADGHFPVRWMPDANYGYGYPFYNYYAPLSIYIAAVFRFLGFSFVRSIHAAQLLGFVVAGLGMFALGRRWLGSPWAGLLAAVAYTVAPFHMVNVYVRGDSLAEFWAMAFYPVILLAADGLLDQLKAHQQAGTTRWRAVARPLALFAVAYAALILSHNISALIFSPFLLLYLVLRLWTGRRETKPPGEEAGPPTGTHDLARPLIILAALLLAFALAAWFFIPALMEQDLAQLSPVTEGYFHYGNHFRGRDLVQTGLLFDYSPDGGMAFRMGLVQAGLALAGAVALVYTWRSSAGGRATTIARDRFTFILLGAAIATFMITPLSRWLWDHLPLLPFTQFPWRFLSVQALFTALLTGALTLWPGRHIGPLVAVPASLVLLAGAMLGLRTDHLILNDADVTAERLAQYEWFTGNIGSTVSAEYLPPAAMPRPYTSAWLNEGDHDRIVALAGRLDSAAVARQATRQIWRVTAGEDGATVQLPTLFWPGWRSTIDDSPADMYTRAGSGLMILDVPPGEHTITLTLERTPVRALAEVMSLAALAGVGLLLVWGGRGRQDSNLRPRLVIVVLAALGVIVVGFIARQNPADRLPDDDLNWDFAQMGYLHHDPDGVTFGNGARLYSYGYSSGEIRAGETLTVTLSLAPGAGQSATLGLATPATARPTPDGAADPPLLVSQTRPLDDETIVFTLPISNQAPAGLYIPRLTIDDARPLMASGQTRGDLFLRPVRVLPAGDHLVAREGIALTPSPEKPFTGDVRALALVERDPETLDGQFAWLTWQPVAQRYQVSWRVQDANGAILSQLDTQPGYGFQPTSLWPAVALTYDWLALRLPERLSGPSPHPLVMILYDPVTGTPLLQRRLGELVEEGGGPVFRSIKPVFTPPDDSTPVNVSVADGQTPVIWLQSYDLSSTGSTLRLALYWQAMAAMEPDYTRFVHLIDAATGEIVAQVDGHVAGNSYPTSQWVVGEVISDVVEFRLPGGQAEDYRLATGFYLPIGDQPRLEITGPEGALPDRQIVLP